MYILGCEILENKSINHVQSYSQLPYIAAVKNTYTKCFISNDLKNCLCNVQKYYFCVLKNKNNMNKKIEGINIHIGDTIQLEAASKSLGEKIPHMVVVEVVKEKVEGNVRYKYNCVWFIREKIWDFKYTWLSVSPITFNPLRLVTEKHSIYFKYSQRT